MNASNSKTSKNKKRGEAKIVAIGSVTVDCAPAPGMPAMKNVTVTATGVTAPLGSPASCGITYGPNATLTRNGNPVGSQQMTADASTPPKWATTFFSQAPGTYTATVNVNWQIMISESANSAAKDCT